MLIVRNNNGNKKSRIDIKSRSVINVNGLEIFRYSYTNQNVCNLPLKKYTGLTLNIFHLIPLTL